MNWYIICVTLVCEMLGSMGIAMAALPVVTAQAPHAFVLLEVARNEADRRRGLMGRTKLAPHHGMIFVSDADQDQYFWMKDTLIPLDMVFVDAGGKVTSIARNVPSTTPATADAAIPRRRGFGRFVVELPAGEAGADGLQAGLHLRLPPFP